MFANVCLIKLFGVLAAGQKYHAAHDIFISKPLSRHPVTPQVIIEHTLAHVQVKFLN